MAFRTFDTNDLTRRSLIRSGGSLAAGAALSSLPFGRAAFAHDVSESWPNVAALAEKYLSQGKVANLFLTFGWGQQSMAHTVGGGTLSLDGTTEVNEDSLYRIYSMTKPVTGMMTMMLIDDGKFGLDTPLHEILPAFRDMMVQKQYDGAITEDNLEPAKRPITIRHLLTHTAGLGYGIVQKGPIKKAYEDKGLVPGQVTKLPIPGLGDSRPAGSLQLFADRLAELPLVLQPGTKWSYSVSLDLLGRVIEVVEGKPFDEVLKERIFDPCGMTSTYFTVPRSEVKRLTDNYGILAGMPLPLDPAVASIYLDKPAFPYGGAGLVSSPADFDRFQRMLLNFGAIDGMRVMSEEMVRVGTSNLLPETVTTEGTWVAGQGFGAGGRSVNGTYGWGGAAGTLAAVDYNLGLRSALWTQYMPTDAYPMREEFLAALEKDLEAMREARAEAA